MLIALDTNILAYSQGMATSPADDPKIVTTDALLQRAILAQHQLFAPVQAFIELRHLLVRKARLSIEQATAMVKEATALFSPIPTGRELLLTALDLARDHRLQIFDAIILGAAAEARCDLLLSEDMQDGFIWRGVRVLNPLTGAPLPF